MEDQKRRYGVASREPDDRASSRRTVPRSLKLTSSLRSGVTRRRNILTSDACGGGCRSHAQDSLQRPFTKIAVRPSPDSGRRPVPTAVPVRQVDDLRHGRRRETREEVRASDSSLSENTSILPEASQPTTEPHTMNRQFERGLTTLTELHSAQIEDPSGTIASIKGSPDDRFRLSVPWCRRSV